MILFFILNGICVLFCIGFLYLTAWLADNYHDYLASFSAFLVFLFICGIIIFLIVGVGFVYKRAEVKTNLINKQYNTNYTVNEVFWSGDTVDKIIKTNQDLLDTNNKLKIDKN